MPEEHLTPNEGVTANAEVLRGRWLDGTWDPWAVLAMVGLLATSLVLIGWRLSSEDR